MRSHIHPYLTEPDLLLLRHLFADHSRKHQTSGLRTAGQPKKDDDDDDDQDHDDQDHDDQDHDDHDHECDHDQAALARLRALNDPNSPHFAPTVFVTWDDKDIHPVLNRYLVRPYAKVASRIVRHPTDVVFLTHILLYLTVNLTSAVLLFHTFTYVHGLAHVAFTFWCTGAFTLMMHNHIHNSGVLAASWAWLDRTFPYILEPLMGHTWDSYYYHHVKHHHVEGNGPDDLSSTLRYQRDDIWHFLHYVARFLFFVWLDLPLYFLRKNKPTLAAKAFCSEMASMCFLYIMTTKVNARASVFTLIIPFVLLRLGLMIGNWGQHALVDELEPDSDYRSSITLIDVPSNRFCFNDGYHTAHHLNPRRHWREQPLHFLTSKQAYAEGRALVFHNIDYLMMTYRLVVKDYMYLAKCLVPIGQQIGMSEREIADMLRTKTRAFTEEEIREKFGTAGSKMRKPGGSSWRAALARVRNLVPGAVGSMAIGPLGVEAEGVHAKAS